MRSLIVVMAGTLMLGGCGTAGPQVPAQFEGTWGADCTAPFVRFSGGSVHSYPDNADYPLKSATLTGQELVIAYTSPTLGEAVEHYAVAGSTLQLGQATYGGQETVWHKAPMQKCP